MNIPWPFLMLTMLVFSHGTQADAISDITNSPNYSTTYGARNILGGTNSIGQRGYIDDSLRGDHWQRAYNPAQVPMEGVIDPRALTRSIQTILTKLGMNPGPVDGNMGMQTHQAILRYQKKHHLNPSGIPSVDLWRHLNAEQSKIIPDTHRPHEQKPQHRTE